ncbi:MAG TPA: hypothetical protein PKH24_01265 [Sedimentisphaerales bacterium]|jgi:outer membrane protein assembly factor BamB|nr:hypothetical protein [Sedimentisphaerales bacterium]HNU28168.1 hypothetical protein [Sedimentisphaerales bacterium]
MVLVSLLIQDRLRDGRVLSQVYLGLMLTLLSARAYAVDDGWPMLGHDCARSGATATEIRPPFARKWYRLFPDEGLMAGVQPVIAGGEVFVGTMRGSLHAMDVDTGHDAWVHRCDGAIPHTCAVGGGKVVFGDAARLRGVSFRGYHAVIAPDGSVMVRTTPSICLDIPWCRADLFYIQKRILCLEADGRTIWETLDH